MPYGYLINGIVFAVLVLCAIAPPRRPRPLAKLASVLATAINELPFVFCYALLAATAVAAVQGDLASAGAWVAVTLNMLNLVGVAVIAAQAVRASTVLADALSTVDITVPPRRLPWPRILLWPWRTRPVSVRRVANVRYAPGNRRTTLDVYHHRSRPVGGPVLIHLHGGFFRIGRKSTQSMPLLHHLAARGGSASAPTTGCFPYRGPPRWSTRGASSRGFVTALRRVGAQTVVYAELPGTQHGFDRFHSVRFEAIIDAIESFCVRVLERRS